MEEPRISKRKRGNDYVPEAPRRNPPHNRAGPDRVEGVDEEINFLDNVDRGLAIINRVRRNLFPDPNQFR